MSARVWVNSFWYPKVVGRERAWEDACRYHVARGRFAVADGASSSYRSREWARLLVDGYVEGPPEYPASRENTASWFAERARAWQRAIEAEAAEPDPLAPWWEQVEPNPTTHAAFLGVRLVRQGDEVIRSTVALGDSCLFHLRGDAVTSFPLTDPGQFSHGSVLASTDPAAVPVSHIAHESAVLGRGDVLVLATDALAKTLLTYGDDMWPAVRTMDHPRFRALVADLRTAGAMEIDDVAAVRITYHGPGHQ